MSEAGIAAHLIVVFGSVLGGVVAMGVLKATVPADSHVFDELFARGQSYPYNRVTSIKGRFFFPWAHLEGWNELGRVGKAAYSLARAFLWVALGSVAAMAIRMALTF